MKNQFSDFYFSELWLIVFIMYCDTPSVPPAKKKSCSKVAKFTGKMLFFKKLFFSSLVVFGGLLVLRYGRFCMHEVVKSGIHQN